MAIRLTPCPGCGHLREMSGPLCPGCTRYERHYGRDIEGGNTRFHNPDWVGILALPLAFMLLLEIRVAVLLIGSVMQAEWLVGGSFRLFEPLLLVGLGFAFVALFSLGTAVLARVLQVGKLEFEIPDWPLPLRGRWLKYFLAIVTLGICAVGATKLDLGWIAMFPGFWVALLLSAFLVAGHYSGTESASS